MKYDKIEKISNTVIQHGKNNDRIYVMKLDKNDYPKVLKKINSLADKNQYSKIFAKIPKWAVDEFKNDGYIKEGTIPRLYNGKTDAFFYSKFLDHSRAKISPEVKKKIDDNIKLALSKKKPYLNIHFKPGLKLKKLNENNIRDLAKLYKTVFNTYPFPIFDPDFLKNTMDNNVVYFGVYEKQNLIAAASSEMYVATKNAEMTDFATHPDYRGHNLSMTLLREMEAEMRLRKMKTLYTIARSHSAGMNITFSKLNYIYSGTLINNTDIAGKIESMNIWYKNL
jgi:putative beta-lysine N-acetyltransferase